MVEQRAYLTTAILCLILPLTALAAEVAQPEKPDPLSIAGILAMGLGFFILALVLYLGFFAIFVHAASRVVGLGRPFGTAFYAVVLNIVFQFVFSILVSLFARGNDGWYLLASWGGATAAIMAAYDASFLRSLAAAVIAVILTVVGVVVSLFALAAVFSQMGPARG